MNIEIEQANLESMDFEIGGRILPLYISRELFIPNQTTQLFADAIKNAGISLADKKVFDIGSGVGPIAIFAAKEGSKEVHAVEIVEEQYELLKRNVERNNVGHKVHPYCGSFFDPIPDGIKADIIFADCSGMAEKPARASPWYKPKIPTGGEDGTQNVIYILEQAGRFFSENARLYFPIAVGFSNHERILDTARARFNSLEIRAHDSFPLPQKERDAILEVIPDSFKECLERKGSRYRWRAEIYEAFNPK